MDSRPLFLMTDPSGFDVSYRINPWMKPQAWTPDCRAAAQTASSRLRAALEAAGGRVEIIGAVHGQPDLVFPANAAVVLDGRVPHAMLLEFFTSKGAGTLIRKV